MERTPVWIYYSFDGRRYISGGHVISEDIVYGHGYVLDRNNVIFLYDIVYDDLVYT